MFGLKQAIKKIFGGKQKSSNTEESPDDAIRSRFKTKYWDFKNPDYNGFGGGAL